jgi:hypothetical protein
MKRTVLAATLAAAFTASTAAADGGATMSPDVITQGAATASAPANGLVFGILLVGLVAAVASGGGSGYVPR